jgi:hypothetical protein
MDNITCESHQGQEQGVWSGGMFVIITGWWFFATPLKNMSSSDGIIIPNRMEKKNMIQTTNQIPIFGGWLGYKW